MNLGTSLHWVSTKMKGKVCLLENGDSVSYKELWETIELLADAFLKIGLKENDKVAIILPNCKEFIYSFYALARINVISIPLNPTLTSYELKDIFKDCGPDAIISLSTLYIKKIQAIFGKKSILIDKAVKEKDSYSFNELFKLGKPKNLPSINTSNNQIATINYTYRGLGKPMGAVLTHGNYHHGAIGYVRLTEVETEQRVMLLIPISHIFTLVSCVIVPLLRGATVSIVKTFIPKHIFKAIEEQKIDFIMAVPTAYISLFKNFDKSRYNISTLKYGITGGSYLPAALQKDIKKTMGLELLQGYGLTETMPISCNPRSKNKPESLGVPGHEVLVKVVDKDGKETEVRERGEIIIGGPTVMKGYYNKDKENKEYLKDGWFYTGDWGWLDEEGYIYFNGLKKDIVKVGGNNVDLKELSSTLRNYDGVKDVTLELARDELWGNEIRARIKVSPKSEITPKAIKSYCIKHLSPYKIPRKITIES
ncbi:MAG: AMP-binding protein [Candidatus Omnitrophota bacterium]